MRDTRTGTAGRASHQTPHLQHMRNAPRAGLAHQRQVQSVVDSYAKNPRASARRLRELGMKPDFIRAIHRSAVPNKRTEPLPGVGHRIVSGVQETLDTVGLGGAAHPIRRLEHPGGRMEFPGFGKIPGLGGNAARAELEGNAIRNAVHANIEKTIPDAAIAKGLKKAYDAEVLKASKKHGMAPGEYLKRVHAPEQHVMRGLRAGKAKAAYQEQKVARSEELKRRVERADAALMSGTGEEAFRAGKRELKGVLPKGQFHGLRDLSDEQLTKLREHVQHHPDLQFFDKSTVWDAVRNAHQHGQVPAPHEYRLMEKAFGPNVARELFHPSKIAKYRHMAVEAANIPRALMSSLDVSAPLRQGLIGLVSHPIISGKELKPMLKSLASESAYRADRAKLEKHPLYEQALNDGVALTDIEHALSNREEPFQSNYAERIPVAGRVVRSSGRAYNRFLVGQRFGIYKHLLMHAEDAGEPLSDKARQQLAHLVNSATGRGQGRPGGFFERNAVELNAALFSPRLIKSRFDFLNPLSYHKLDPMVRAEKIKMAVKTAGAISAFLYAMSKVAGVKVEADPRSSDFGKIRVGNTRIDVGGGFNQYIRVIAQAIANGQLDPNTGDLKHGHTADVLMRFARSKLAPTPSAGVDLLFRQNFAGKPLDWKKELATKAFPIGLQDAYSVLHHGGAVLPTSEELHNNLPGAIGAYGASAIGLGVQSYGPPKPTGKTIDDMRADLKVAVHKYFNMGLTPQIKHALKLRAARESYFKEVLPKRPGRGTSDKEKKTYALHRFNAQVDLLMKLRLVSGGRPRAHHAKEWAKKQDYHAINAETSRIGHEYFGGIALSDAAAKIRERGGHFYLSDY